MLSLPSHLGRASFSTTAKAMAIKTVTVVGSGLMGSGIVQVAAATGHKVHMVDMDEKLLEKAKARIQQSLQRVAAKQFKDQPEAANKFLNDTMANINATTKTDQAAAASDLVIEAIVENLDVKKEIFSKLDKVAPSHTIFASNTSSLSVEKIASATKREDRFGGLHFFNPVPVMKLLEIVKTSHLSQKSLDELVAFGKALGKSTVICGDTPGFIVNRLLVPYIAEAIRMYERGDATAADIDTAMQLGAGMPMGPLTLADYVGLDTTHYILEGWSKSYPDQPLFKSIPLIAKLVSEKKLGVKTGEGFYKYDNKGNKIVQ